MRLRLRSAISMAIGGVVAVTGILVSAAPASASTIPVQGSGIFSCSTVSGRITFRPPLQPYGTKPETVNISLVAKGCSGGTPTPTTVKGKLSIHFASNSCGQGSDNGDGTLTYGRKIEPSEFFGVGYGLSADAQGNPLVTEGDRNEVTGSYYSDMFTDPPTGAIWRFYPNWTSTNVCSKRMVRTATFGSDDF